MFERFHLQILIKRHSSAKFYLTGIQSINPVTNFCALF